MKGTIRQLKRALPGMLALLLANAAYSGPEYETCKGIAIPLERLSCYDAASNSVQNRGGGSAAAGFGSVEGTITWQYNNRVGTQGDVGAEISLIGSDFSQDKLTPQDRSMLALGLLPTHNEKVSVYQASADGYGSFKIPRVRAGSYIAVIKSAKTNGPHAPEYDQDFAIKRCKQGDAGKVFDPRYFQFSKFHCSKIRVEGGAATVLSHDFGNTYW